MHQIQFRLGLLPRPAWELTALTSTLAGFKGPTSKGREGRGEEGEGEGREIRVMKKERGGRGRAREGKAFPFL